MKLLNLDNIKEIVEERGFQTSWRNPFIEWHRPELFAGEPEIKTEEILYVRDPPVNWLAPFDLAMISIRIDDEGIFFELSLYYVNVLEDQIDASVINEIYDHHQCWHDGIIYFYSDVAEKFSLKWDTEYDYYIKDTLYGHLESEESLLSILNMLKNIYEDRFPWISWNGEWSSDFPEIECKLKKYRDSFELLERIPYW